jgi:prepilin signal peptidase PulO-like enzyme (type II secretory pathway)
MTRLSLCLWIAALGACVGSFLNVVIYRWPRGLSLVHPGSQCPHCHHPVRWYHNIPVLSWIALRGRCHDCGAAISVRYPIVEALTGGMFVAVALAEPLSFDVGWRLFVPGPAGWIAAARWAVWGYHVFLLCTLLCLGMIQWDAEESRTPWFPWPTWAAAILIGVAMPLAAGPISHAFISADDQLALFLSLAILPGVTTDDFLEIRTKGILAGLLAGFGFGSAFLISRTTAPDAMWKHGTWSDLGSLVLVFTFLGARAVIEIALATATWLFFASGLARFRFKSSSPRHLYVFGMTLAWLVLWKPLVGWQPQFDPQTLWLPYLAMIPILVLLVLGAWSFRR